MGNEREAVGDPNTDLSFATISRLEAKCSEATSGHEGPWIVKLCASL